MFKLALTLLFTLSLHASSLKVLTFNIGALLPHSSRIERGIEIFCERVKKFDYDLVFIQEAWITSYRKKIIQDCQREFHLDLDSKTGILRNQAQGRIKSFKGHFVSWLFRYIIPDYGVDSGMLILSKYKLDNPKRLFFSVSGSEDYLLDGELLVSKGAIGANLLHPRLGKIFVANTHLTSNYVDHQYDKNRLQQLKELSTWFRKQGGQKPAVLGGDFNISPPGKRYLNNETLWSALRKSYFKNKNFLNLDFKNLTTYPGEGVGKDEGFVDHLIGLNGAFPKKGKVIKLDGVSDHYALGARVIIETKSLKGLKESEELAKN
ncbi:endonuclease/exonuclease/phosphatase family protein [Bacteriovorax sp. DB6_IX]|uniref:endonuclease/exonuclease/phosphatase family protein n=1 Tax=Bacteriovorax sp. DB6_IX TaxID=1353530 RepID=UPI000389F60F|nr:endonuclease/exonuclease/phosphatase family protein [Bacteriovorax sp. DB6_IX]EQC52581.1 endonuclease/exonuclease/phosphatase family protein [Bacteriovorax sp. DB6_IX]